MARFDSPAETNYLRNALADRLDVHPFQEWSPAVLKTVTALLDMYVADALQDKPAPVLRLVPAADGPVKL